MYRTSRAIRIILKYVLHVNAIGASELTTEAAAAEAPWDSGMAKECLCRWQDRPRAYITSLNPITHGTSCSYFTRLSLRLISSLSLSIAPKKLLYRWQENFFSARGIKTIKNFSLRFAISRWLKNYASDISEKRHCVKMKRNETKTRSFLVFFNLLYIFRRGASRAWRLLQRRAGRSGWTCSQDNAISCNSNIENWAA